MFQAMTDPQPLSETVLLGTGAPIQVVRMELYDLMRILHRGCERGAGWNRQQLGPRGLPPFAALPQ